MDNGKIKLDFLPGLYGSGHMCTCILQCCNALHVINILFCISFTKLDTKICFITTKYYI